MQIDIHAREFSLSAALLEHVERQLYRWRRDHRERLQRISVSLSDCSSARGGEDMRSRILLRVSGLSDIVVDERDQDLYAAVTRSMHRAGVTLGRRLGKAAGRARD